MDFAVIQTGSKQYTVSVGDTIRVEKLSAHVGDTVQFDTLMVFDAQASKVDIGTPILPRKVEGKIAEHGRGEKILVVKFKSKTRYRRNRGHRQAYSKVRVTKI